MESDFLIPEDMRRRYLERRHADVPILEAALILKDFGQFRRIGHQLKGNAASYGYPDLGAIAVAIEEAGESESLEAAQLQIERLKAWLIKNPA